MRKARCEEFGSSGFRFKLVKYNILGFVDIIKTAVLSSLFSFPVCDLQFFMMETLREKKLETDRCIFFPPSLATVVKFESTGFFLCAMMTIIFFGKNWKDSIVELWNCRMGSGIDVGW